MNRLLFNDDIYVNHITAIPYEDAQKIEYRIQEENKHKAHMLTRTADDIIHNVKVCSGVVARMLQGDSIQGFMGLTETQKALLGTIKVFERGSLIVDPSLRGLGLGNFLRAKLLESNTHKGIYTVTNVPKVIQVNIDIGEKMYTQNALRNVSQELYEIIALEGAFYEDDVIFMNEKLESYLLKQF